MQPAAGVGQVTAAAVEVAQLVRGHPRRGHLAVRVTKDQPGLQPGPGRPGQGLRGSAQQPADPVERVVAVAAAVQRLLLDPAADLIDGGQAEAGHVEGVQYPHRGR